MDEKQSELQIRAILLLGPTGSGKTPLGDLLEKEGLAGHECFHFDFGAQLRGYAANPTGLLSDVELEIVKISLGSGALLTDSQFGIAEKLLGEFIEKNRIGSGDLTIMNGLPRHKGQAAALKKFINMMAVVVLDCDPPTVMERIRTDAGRDRGGRIDDTTEDVVQKLAIFAEKTLPLLKFYEGYGVPVIHIDVGTYDSAIKSRGALAVKITNVLD
ncbi:MAG: nucleoside monophosphate kinase [Dehalogenimonas sp.]